MGDITIMITANKEVRIMPRFIAVHSEPLTEEEFKEFAKHRSQKGFSWKTSYCDFDDNKFFCDWEAPSKEALGVFLQKVGLTFDEIYPVRLFNVAKAKFQ